MENCNDCRLINITEEEQTDKTISHICLKYNVRLFHRSSDPKIEHEFIYPCEQCSGKDFEDIRGAL